ncbi:MAG: hypothetical protein NXH97_22395 [Rhodobacteraceae bacterium]|nr:hypothetical protein [Paracoccaceae bacterium]
MSNDRQRVGFHEGAIIWHVDDLGIFHWGSPAAREEAFRREDARRDRARDEKLFRERRAAHKQPMPGHSR